MDIQQLVGGVEATYRQEQIQMVRGGRRGSKERGRGEASNQV